MFAIAIHTTVPIPQYSVCEFATTRLRKRRVSASSRNDELLASSRNDAGPDQARPAGAAGGAERAASGRSVVAAVSLRRCRGRPSVVHTLRPHTRFKPLASHDPPQLRAFPTPPPPLLRLNFPSRGARYAPCLQASKASCVGDAP